jgi:hypothetical protein
MPEQAPARRDLERLPDGEEPDSQWGWMQLFPSLEVRRMAGQIPHHFSRCGSDNDSSSSRTEDAPRRMFHSDEWDLKDGPGGLPVMVVPGCGASRAGQHACRQ